MDTRQPHGRDTIRPGDLVGEVIRRGNGWSLRFYEAGRRRVVASKQTSFADAKRMLREIEARIARGELGVPERRRDWPTVGELAERFLSEYSRPRLKDLDRYRATCRSVLQKVLPHIGRASVAGVTQADVTKLRDGLLQRYAPGTVYNALAVLSALFSWGVRGGHAPGNPCKGVERPTAAQALDYLGRDEVRRLRRRRRGACCTWRWRWPSMRGCARASFWGCAGSIWTWIRAA